MATESGEDVSERRCRLYEVIGAYYAALAAGQAPDIEEICTLHPDLAADLKGFFDDQDGFHRVTQPLRLVARPSADEITATVSIEGDASGNNAPADGAKTWRQYEAGAYDAGTHVRNFGDYELIEEVAGGMGVVYKARQRSLNRPVALKMMLAGQFASPDDLRRFRNEAEAVANLDHANIVPVYEVGEQEGFSYFAMKLVEGGSLAGRLTEFAADPKAAARLLSAVARAVHHAHRAACCTAT